MLWFDLVVAADQRQPGADGRCLAAMLAAAAAAGYRTGLLPLRGRVAGRARPTAPALRALLAEGRITWLDPEGAVQADTVLVHHMAPLLAGLDRASPVRAARCLLRLDQPVTTGAGESLVDLPALRRHAVAAFGQLPELVAADPLVAASLPLGAASGLVADHWLPITALRAADVPAEGRHRLGRHCLGGGGAVPASTAALLAAYPADAAHRVMLAEAAVALAQDLRPPGWHVAHGELAEPQAFLAGLDAYVFATGPSWRAFVPAGLVEALAAAPLLVVPPCLEGFFGEAACYLPPGGTVADLLGSLTPAAIQACRRAAVALHRRMTAPEALARRLRQQLGPPLRTPPRLELRRETRAPRNVLFLTPNGVGMGHLTRLLAIARHGPGSIRPVFLSMSQAVGVVERFGFVAEYFPYHGHTGETAEAWNQALRARLNEAIAFYDARCVVFDGNVPYLGLVDARQDNANRPFVWIRRGMWRPDAGRATIDRARHFDLVIEPGEFAAADDPGITAGRDGEALRVAPITLHEPDELPSRAAARAALGLDPERPAVILQLGARNNFDFRQVDRVVLDVLGPRTDVQIAAVDWLIGEAAPELPAVVKRLRDFPIARHLPAFDLAVSACGYNSFHELLGLGIPSILIPNENPMMDAQEVRALWADRRGHGICVRSHETYRLAWAVQRLLEPEVQARMREAARVLPACAGAREAASLIADLAGSQPVADGRSRMPQALLRTLQG